MENHPLFIQWFSDSHGTFPNFSVIISQLLLSHIISIYRKEILKIISNLSRLDKAYFFEIIVNFIYEEL